MSNSHALFGQEIFHNSLGPYYYYYFACFGSLTQWYSGITPSSVQGIMGYQELNLQSIYSLSHLLIWGPYFKMGRLDVFLLKHYMLWLS